MPILSKLNAVPIKRTKPIKDKTSWSYSMAVYYYIDIGIGIWAYKFTLK